MVTKVSFKYTKLWKLALDNNLNKTQLRDAVGMSNDCLSKLSKNKYVSMNTLDKICTHFNCDISDIVEYVKDGEKIGKNS